jgi:hypothetical protein
MKAKTFWGDEPDDVIVEIISKIGSTDTYKCRFRDKDIVRHRDRLTPIDDEAKQFLAKGNN